MSLLCLDFLGLRVATPDVDVTFECTGDDVLTQDADTQNGLVVATLIFAFTTNEVVIFNTEKVETSDTSGQEDVSLIKLQIKNW
jgi:hypothetical protein